MERTIEIIRRILRGVILGGCACVFVLMLYRIVNGPDAAILRCAVFLTFVIVAANIVRNHLAEWITGIVAMWRVLVKGDGNR